MANKIKGKKKIKMPNQCFNDYSKWVNALDFKDFTIVNNFVAEEVVKLSKKRNEEFYNDMVEALDRSVTAALILDTDLDLDVIDNIFKTVYELVDDDVSKSKKLIERYGDMAKATAKFSQEVMDSSIRLLEAGVKNQKQAIETLVNEFPTLSKSMLTNAFKKCKEEMKTKEKIKTLEKILDFEEVTVTKDDVEVAAEYILEPPVVEPVVEPKEVQAVEENQVDQLLNTSVPEQKNLKVINRTIEMTIEGKLNTYYITNKTVKTNHETFNSVEEVKEQYEKEIEKLEAMKNELIAVYGMI